MMVDKGILMPARNLFGDNRSLRFQCVNFGWRTFYFISLQRRTKMKKILYVLLVITTLFLFSSCQHVHEFGNWNTVKSATCIEEGLQERYCSCGEKQSNTVAALGHEFGNWNTVKSATCIEEGLQERYCSCGEKQSNTVAALGHQYQKGTCNVCGAKNPDYVTYGSVAGTITWKYNNYVGSRGDTGATVILVPKGDYTISLQDNSDAAHFREGRYENGIVVTKCDGNGRFDIEHIPTGDYFIFVSSKNVTTREAFKDYKNYQAYVQLMALLYFSKDDLETLANSVNYYAIETGNITVYENSTTTFSHDFGITYI